MTALNKTSNIHINLVNKANLVHNLFVLCVSNEAN